MERFEDGIEGDILLVSFFHGFSMTHPCQTDTFTCTFTCTKYQQPVGEYTIDMECYMGLLTEPLFNPKLL